MKFRNKVILAFGIFLFFFVVANMVIFAVTGIEQTALISAVFGISAVEGGILGWMRKLDKESGDESETRND